jgi:hypothetical protein
VASGLLECDGLCFLSLLDPCQSVLTVEWWGGGGANFFFYLCPNPLLVAVHLVVPTIIRLSKTCTNACLQTAFFCN